MATPPTGFTAYLSEHRFRVMLGACFLALILMMAVIYSTVGFGPPWGSSVAVPA